MDVYRGQLVDAVEHEGVLPDHDGVHEDAHAEDVVCLVPGQAGGEEKGDSPGPNPLLLVRECDTAEEGDGPWGSLQLPHPERRHGRHRPLLLRGRQHSGRDHSHRLPGGQPCQQPRREALNSWEKCQFVKHFISFLSFL